MKIRFTNPNVVIFDTQRFYIQRFYTTHPPRSIITVTSKCKILAVNLLSANQKQQFIWFPITKKISFYLFINLMYFYEHEISAIYVDKILYKAITTKKPK